MRDFRELKVWQKAHQLVLEVYRHSKGFPSEERFGLIAHLRKSATSVPSNIAEGCGRDGDKELSRFLNIAAGSASELDYQLLLARDLGYQLLLARDLGYLPSDDHRHLAAQVGEVRRMLYRFIESLSPADG